MLKQIWHRFFPLQENVQGSRWFAERLRQQSLNILLNNPKTISHVPEVRPSSIVGAGYGVFIAQGRLERHSVACLYPGSYYPPPPPIYVGRPDGETPTLSAHELRKIHGLDVHGKNTATFNVKRCSPVESDEVSSEYQIHCDTNGGYIDAINVHPHRLYSDYVAGHLVNHPPKGVVANVMPVDFLWADILEVADESLLSDISASDSSGNDTNSSRRLKNLVNRINPIGSGIWYIDSSSLLSLDEINLMSDIKAGKEQYPSDIADKERDSISYGSGKTNAHTTECHTFCPSSRTTVTLTGDEILRTVSGAQLALHNEQATVHEHGADKRVAAGAGYPLAVNSGETANKRRTDLHLQSERQVAHDHGIVYLSDGCSPSVGLALVALRDIEAGEELHLDYRFDPNLRKDVYPPWYHVPPPLS